jgi:hypothetical protein
MKIKNKGSVNTQADQKKEIDNQPLIDLFALLLEWDMQDVQEKAEQRKKVS